MLEKGIINDLTRQALAKDPYAPQKKHLSELRDKGWRQIKVMLSPEQIEAVDGKRGDRSRTAYVKRLIEKDLGPKK